MKARIAIIGGGAAGMMAAAALSELKNIDAEIHLFEKNKMLGAKVLISGGGRCNVTTGMYKNNELLKNYPRGAEFLKYTFSKFGPRKIKNRFEDHGAKLKEEADHRIFPVSNKGSDIVGIFEKMFSNTLNHPKNEGNEVFLDDGGIPTTGENLSTNEMKGLNISKAVVCEKVILHFGESIVSIKKNKKFTLVSDISSYEFDYVILTTGGSAYAHTGSSGDGYTFARECGHTITPLGPSLNSFLTKETWTHPLSGLSFKNAMLHIKLHEKKLTAMGGILLTHFGISGPATFVISAYSAFEKIDETNSLEILVQAYSDYDFNRRNTFLLTAMKEQPNKELQTILGQKFSKRFVEEFLRFEKIDAKQHAIQLTKSTRESLANKLGNGFPLHAISRRPGDEFVTAGGVDTNEVNNETMESTLCKGLYFAGEILNIDGFTGGFNLQSSRATGMIAGLSIGSKLRMNNE